MSNPTNAMIPPSLLSGFTSLALKANEFVTKSTFTNYGEMNSGQGLLFF